jgi:Enoyl-CoA hydratase/carnithine racemase
MTYNTLSIEKLDSVSWCKLNRPEVRNAFNAEMIAELTHFARNLDADVRTVVLLGEGPVFCAGGDLRWMQQSLEMDREQNRQDARRLAEMYFALDRLRVPLIGSIHGAAFGGGAGLVCVCDYAIAQSGTKFSFSEVRLGIVPACISPFVLRKIGPGYARSLFLTAERFEVQRAYEIGLVHRIAESPEEAQNLVKEKIQQVLECGPEAIRHTKNLMFELLFASGDEEQLNRAADLLASVRVSEEGQDGLRAFLEKRKPRWHRE